MDSPVHMDACRLLVGSIEVEESILSHSVENTAEFDWNSFEDNFLFSRFRRISARFFDRNRRKDFLGQPYRNFKFVQI